MTELSEDAWDELIQFKSNILDDRSPDFTASEAVGLLAAFRQLLEDDEHSPNLSVVVWCGIELKQRRGEMAMLDFATEVYRAYGETRERLIEKGAWDELSHGA